jgi:myosin heavy subunit
VLERKRGEKLSQAALKIQKTWRGYKDFRRYRNILRAVVRLQTCTRRSPP